ncbi:MAG TPA: hypothetical protein VFF52_01370, partial [Isosphaeraceae bacterium]|nr:hypothetical protein [Isosphaeraceae bacterium]
IPLEPLSGRPTPAGAVYLTPPAPKENGARSTAPTAEGAGIPPTPQAEPVAALETPPAETALPPPASEAPPAEASPPPPTEPPAEPEAAPESPQS